MANQENSTSSASASSNWFEELCRKHPWCREAEELGVEYNKKLAVMRERGEDPETLYEDSRTISVDDAINYAKLTLETPDVLCYWQEHIDEKKKHGEHRVSDEFLDILSRFETWFFLRQGKPPQNVRLFAGRTLLGKVLEGEIEDLESAEVRTFVRSQQYVRD